MKPNRASTRSRSSSAVIQLIATLGCRFTRMSCSQPRPTARSTNSRIRVIPIVEWPSTTRGCRSTASRPPMHSRASTPTWTSGGPPTVRHGTQEFLRRTVVPRIPSILFAVLFLSCAYLLGRTVSGYATAWSLLMPMAFVESFVWFGWQARYYSATLAFSTLSGLAIWNLTRRGMWRDSVATGLALVLLFHTHSLSFLILMALLLANVPVGFKQPRWLSKLMLTGAVVALGIVPWMFWTGFLNAGARIPSAWPLLVFPQDFVSWFAARKVFVGIIGSVVAALLVSAAFPPQRLPRLIASAATDKHAFYFAATWFALAYAVFRLSHSSCELLSRTAHARPGRARLSAVRAVHRCGRQDDCASLRRCCRAFADTRFYRHERIGTFQVLSPNHPEPYSGFRRVGQQLETRNRHEAVRLSEQSPPADLLLGRTRSKHCSSTQGIP